MTTINYAMYKAKNRPKNDSGTKEQKQNYTNIWKA